MITRVALVVVCVWLVIASARTAPLEVSLAQQLTQTPTSTPASTSSSAVALRAAVAQTLTRVPTQTPKPTPIVSPTATGSPTPSPSPTPVTPSLTAAPTLTVAPTLTATPTLTAQPTLTATPVQSPAAPTLQIQVFVPPTLIVTPTRTPIPSPTPTPSVPPTPTRTRVPVQSPSPVRTVGIPPNAAPTSPPPLILGLSETSITGSTATISWTTNVPATSEVDVGPDPVTIRRSPVDPALVTSHTLVLTGLSAGTTYSYLVRSATSTGALGVSDLGTFATTPAGSGPSIESLSVRHVTATTAALAWATSSGIVSQVEYGPTANYQAFTLLKVFTAPAQEQAMVLTSLQPGVRYHFRIKTWDASGVLGASGDFTFRTAQAGLSTLAGDQTLFANRGSLVNGQAAAYPSVAAQSGQANVVRVYLDAGTPSAGIRVAVYADLAGRPGAILAQGSAAPGLAPGWTSISIPPLSVTQGQSYWIAVLSPVGGGGVTLRVAADGGTGLLSRQTTLAAFPAVWTAGDPTASSRISASLQQVPPTVTLITPNDGALVSGSVPLGAVVEDDVAIARLQFSVDGVPVGPPLATPPYTTTWDSSGFSTAQPHSITVRAFDLAGRSQESIPVSLQVDNGPAITAVVVNPGLTASSARITWTTDALADSQIEFGTTTSYGLTTPTDTRLTSDHEMQVTGLAPETAYHFRVRSRDANGVLAVSADATFVTSDRHTQVVAD